MQPIEPPPTPWDLALTRPTLGEDLVAVGADLEPGTILAAYRNGLFPMGLGVGGAAPMGWWSPDPRGLILPAEVPLSRSLRRAVRRFSVTVDVAFDGVVAACADPSRTGGWITPQIRQAYGALHRLGWAHSIEVWHEDELVGGLYGLGIGGFFAGESMFHHITDASKVALIGLVTVVKSVPGDRALIDVQWRTDHLATLGAREVSRSTYQGLLRGALAASAPRWPAGELNVQWPR